MPAAPQPSGRLKRVTLARRRERPRESKILRSKETNKIEFLKGEEIGARRGFVPIFLFCGDRPYHFPDCKVEADKYRPGNDVMADIEFGDLGNGRE